MRLLVPHTLEELLTLKAQHGTDAQLIAGGTDLGVRLRQDARPPAVLLSTGHMEHHDATELDPQGAEPRFSGPVGGAVAFDARTTHRAVERLGATARLRGLADACRTIGSVQTRNVGTLAGNIANASPAADAVTALVSLRATVTLQSLDGARTLPLREFAIGPGKTVLEPHEVIHLVEVPAAGGRWGTAFHKLGRRRAMEISIVAVAGALQLDDEGAVTSVGLALAAVGPTVTDVPAATEILRGRTMADADTPRLLDEVAAVASRAAQPRSDHRASATYRRDMTRLLTRRVLTQAWERATDQGDGHG